VPKLPDRIKQDALWQFEVLKMLFEEHHRQLVEKRKKYMQLLKELLQL